MRCLDALRECLAEDTGKVLEAGIKVLKLGQVVKRFVTVVSHQGFQMGVDIDDVHQITVLVQCEAPQPHFDLVMMRVPIVLRPPIATDEKMLGDKIPLDSDTVHRTMLLFGMADDAL
jgi:hypothetical protein